MVSLFRSSILFLLLIAGNALAQPYPAKPIRVLIPYPPGGVLDAIFRPLAQLMGESTGQAIVIDNRPGGNTIMARDLRA
jgi:tripartite-type tricarboxylate transporter receptor subunit TctC